MQATQARFDNIEIPDRPSLSSARPTAASARLPFTAGLSRKRVLLWGGIAGAGLLALAIIAAVFSGSSHKVARSPAEAPLLKGEDQPLKVSPGDPGGRQVPDRDLLVYERMHGTASGKPQVERLLPEPERPLAPPQPHSAVPPAEPPPLGATDALPTPLAEPAPKPVTEAPPAAAVLAKPPAGAATTVQPKPLAATATPAKPKPSVPAPAAQPKPSATTAPPKAPTAVAAKPATKEKTAAATKGTPAEKAKSATGGFQVQLLAGRDEDEVKDAWGKLKAKNPDLLGPLSPTLARAELGDRGTFYRLRAGPLGSEAQARNLCTRLAGRGASCIIIRPAS